MKLEIGHSFPRFIRDFSASRSGDRKSHPARQRLDLHRVGDNVPGAGRKELESGAVMSSEDGNESTRSPGHHPRPSRYAWWSGMLSLLIATGCGCEIVRIAHMTGLARSEYIDANPFNGDFQTFDPIRRLFSGQWLYRDFDVYLGIGPTLLTAVATGVSGGDFRASLYSTMFLCVALHGFVLYFTGRLCGYPRALAAVIALLFVQLIRVKAPFWLNETLAGWYAKMAFDVAQPAGSILAIRVAVGPFTVAVLALTWRWWQRGEADGDRRRSAVVGVAAGLGALWSNDAGIPLAIALFASLILLWLRGRTWFSLVQSTAIAALFAVLSGVVALTIVTRGYGWEWFRFNFLGVARDQFWYYVGDKVLTWSDIPLQASGLGALVCLVWLVLRYSGRGHRDRGSLLFTLLASVYFATLLSQVGGAVQPRYGRPTERLLFLIAPFVLWGMARAAWRRVARIRTPRTEVSVPVGTCGPVRTWLGAAGISVVTAGLLALSARTIIDWQTLYGQRTQHATISKFPSARPAGMFSNPYGKNISVGEALRNELDRENVPPEKRMFSLYVSYLDDTTGARNPTRHDQIIHALGPDRRSRYLADLTHSGVQYASTPRRDKFLFEPWLRCVNWPIYEYLLREFDPVQTTVFEVVWKRRESRREWIGSPHSVAINRLAASTVELRFEIPPPDRKQVRDKALVLVTFDYETDRVPDAWRRGLIRQHLVVEDISVPFRPRDRCLNWGLPVGKGKAAFAVDASLNSANVLYVTLQPEELSRLEIRNAECTTLIPLELIDDVVDAAIFPSPYMLHVPQEQGVVILETPEEARHLRVGDICEFARTGRRMIVNVSGNIIFFDGPPFECEESIFPAMIRVVNPVRRPPGTP
jgi:hypothetical protein